MSKPFVSIFAALDAIPLASVIAVLAALGGVYALIAGQIDYQQFLVGLGVSSGGVAALGHVRNQAGKGH
jgi:hypothetical protein